jgi:hypothetical protein
LGEAKRTDEEIVDEFAALLDRYDGVFVRAERVPSEDYNVTLYLAKRTAAVMRFDEWGRLVDVEALDF